MIKFYLYFSISSFIGSLIYLILLTFKFDPKFGFIFSFIDKMMIFFFTFVLSFLIHLPMLVFNRLLKILKLPKNNFIINLFFVFLSIFALILLYVMGLRGFNDFLYIVLAFVLPSNILFNIFLKKKYV